ncbi:MAG TPA: 3-oxoacyl-ACP reductase family protein [Candidatus Bathyarchaeia archaeon]|nr:3-oxoacyl-ACP reductase family protein [Candidatus Bathyarchaeia archaeon]
MEPLLSLAGRTALVTGASRGIGRAIALALASAGAGVACAARARDQIESTAAAIEAAGGRARAIPLDVTSGEQIRASVKEAESALGSIDILINNAGVTLDKPTLEVSDDEWDHVLAANLTSMFRCARAVAPGMIARGRGKIINLGSMYGVLGVPRYAAYCASKAAVGGLTRSLAAEWARHGIQVNCLAPGYVNTDIPRAALADPRTRERFLSKIPVRRIGEPEEIATLAVYLASAASDFMTGQTVYLDGGQTIAW